MDPVPETAPAAPVAGLARVARRARGLDSLGHPPAAPVVAPAFVRTVVSILSATSRSRQLQRSRSLAQPPSSPPLSSRRSCDHPQHASSRTDSPSSTGKRHGGACSGCAGRRACLVGAVASILSATSRSRQLPRLLSLAQRTSTRRRAGARPPSSLSVAAPSKNFPESRSSPRPCAWTRGSRGPSRSGFSGCEVPGRRPPRDRAIVRKLPPSRTDSRSSRGFAAPRPHRPATMPGPDFDRQQSRRRLLRLRRSPRPPSSAPWPRFSRPPSSFLDHDHARCRSRRARRLGVALTRIRLGADESAAARAPPATAFASARDVVSASRWRAFAIASFRRLRRP